MTSKRVDSVEYMCAKCGKKTSNSPTKGRPMPGNCPKGGVHSWRVNRKIYAH